uniref:Uncharacterized protein n=1 Tax=Lankesteria abbotti TaxID=340204 RepID=A0A7S2QRH7_9APIC
MRWLVVVCVIVVQCHGMFVKHKLTDEGVMGSSYPVPAKRSRRTSSRGSTFANPQIPQWHRGLYDVKTPCVTFLEQNSLELVGDCSSTTTYFFDDDESPYRVICEEDNAWVKITCEDFANNNTYEKHRYHDVVRGNCPPHTLRLHKASKEWHFHHAQSVCEFD